MKKLKFFWLLCFVFLGRFSNSLYAQVDKDKCNIYFKTSDAILKDEKYYVKVFVKNNLGFSSESELINRVNSYNGVLGSKLAMTPGDGGYKELRIIFNEKKADQFFEDMLVNFNVPIIRVNNQLIPSNQLSEFLNNQSKK